MSELSKEKRNMRIEEAAEAILKSLSEDKKHPIYKRVLFRKAEEKVRNERHKLGGHHIPTIRHGNKTIEIKEPDKKFIENNWSKIAFYCAEQYKKYLIFSIDGYRLGTLKEYEVQQEFYKAIADGQAKSHNRNAGLINERGGAVEYIDVQRLQIQSGQ